MISVPWNNNNVRVQDKGGHLCEGVVDLGPILHYDVTSILFPTCTGTFIPESRALPTSAAEWREDCSGGKIDFLGELMSVVSIPSKSKMGNGSIVNNWTSSELLE